MTELQPEVTELGTGADREPSSATTLLLRAVDRNFRRGSTEAPPPTRFYLNLTERCGQRCRHCLTRAPQRTAAGQARDMSEEVLRALRPHLRHALYVGLPHAGEPLLAPLLEPLLLALRQERAGEPTTVHLLTGGQPLTPERFTRLVELGVCSWSISLDGMSPRSHDALRLGSDIGRLRATLGRICSLRPGLPPFRAGIAWTVTALNLAEIPALLAWARELGLDWVKLEELFPLDAAAAELAVGELEQAEAVARAEELARSLGLTLLDHTQPLEIRKCLLPADPRQRALSLADDAVNAMEINPCRLPWELICVEPDGAVRPLSFHHPPAGNLLEEPLESLWNGRGFTRVRSASLARRLCNGRPSCGSDPGPQRWRC